MFVKCPPPCGRVYVQSQSSSVYCDIHDTTLMYPGRVPAGCGRCVHEREREREARAKAMAPPAPRPGGLLYSSWSREQDELRSEFLVQERRDREGR